MQKCVKCKQPFGYKELLKSTILSYKDITCEKCHTIHCVKKSSRVIIAVLIATSVPVWKVISGPTPRWFWGYFIYLAVFIGMVPIIVRYE